MKQGLPQNKKMLTHHYYSERIVLIKKVVKEINEMLEEYRSRRERATKELKEVLAKKSLRRTDFANMMQNLLEVQSSREEEVRKILREFMKETEQIGSKLENLLREPDVKKLKRFITKVQTQQKKKKTKIEEMIEQRLGDTQCNMQALLEEFKNERVALNLEWEKLNEDKERLGHITLSPNPS